MVPTCTLHLFLFTLFNELAVLMNLGHISHHFRPLCQGCDRPCYALPFDDILCDVSCTCIVDYLVLILYNFDNKHTFIVIVIVIALSIVSVKHDCLSIGNQWLISSNGHRISAGHRIFKYIGNVLFEPVARDRFDWEFSGGACTINHILQSYMEYNCLSML